MVPNWPSCVKEGQPNWNQMPISNCLQYSLALKQVSSTKYPNVPGETDFERNAWTSATHSANTENEFAGNSWGSGSRAYNHSPVCVVLTGLIAELFRSEIRQGLRSFGRTALRLGGRDLPRPAMPYRTHWLDRSLNYFDRLKAVQVKDVILSQGESTFV